MKKKIFALLFTITFWNVVVACPVCERQQPKLLRGILHGAGPESNWDYIIIAVMMIITLLTLYYSVKWLMRPGEKSANHIKRIMLEQEDYE